MNFLRCRCKSYFGINQRNSFCSECNDHIVFHFYMVEHDVDPRFSVKCHGGCTLIEKRRSQIIDKVYSESGRPVPLPNPSPKLSPDRIRWSWGRQMFGEHDAYVALVESKDGAHSFHAVLYHNKQWRWAIYDSNRKPLMRKMQASKWIQAHKVEVQIMSFIRNEIKKKEKGERVMQYTWAKISDLMRVKYLGTSDYCLLRLIGYRIDSRWSWEAKDETGDVMWSYGDNYETLVEAQAAAVQWVETHYSRERYDRWMGRLDIWDKPVTVACGCAVRVIVSGGKIRVRI